MTTSVSEGIGTLLRTMLFFFPLYGIGRVYWLKRHCLTDERKNTFFQPRREIVLALFALFMLGLLVLTFENEGVYQSGEGIVPMALFRLKTGIGVNFVPFRTMRRYLKASPNWGRIMINIVGNIVMFLPWGLGLPLLWKKYQKTLKVMGLSLALPLCIEFVQLFIGRSVDIDDVILNFTGGMLGWLLYLILVRIFPGLKELAK